MAILTEERRAEREGLPANKWFEARPATRTWWKHGKRKKKKRGPGDVLLRPTIGVVGMAGHQSLLRGQMQRHQSLLDGQRNRHQSLLAGQRNRHQRQLRG